MPLPRGSTLHIVSRKDAMAQGLKRYFTGKPCKHGHIAERQVTGGCVLCHVHHTRLQYAKQPEQRFADNREYFQRPEVRERNRIRQANLYKVNPELYRSISGRCRAARLLRVPAWSEKDAIGAFYAMCPAGYEVDHVLPLLGKTVSGLHVLGNLQYLPKAENRAKGSRV